MIELNLTYEESKKILELGYDFSKVCSEFRFYEEGAKYTSVRRFEDGDVELYSSQSYDTEIYSIQEFGVTPIIPKAALEACLPEYKGYDHDNVITYRWAGHTSMRSVCFCQFTDDWYIELEDFIHQHKSACEAFIWCHEHYPEELKKKFSEVMG